MKIKSFTIFFTFLFVITGSWKSALAQDNEDFLHVGGALRYNLVSERYESDPLATNTYATWDTWRINVAASYSGVSLDFEYRFYPTFNAHFIKYGYLGYQFSDDLGMQLGVTQVPFGNLTYNSHSWWFMTGYYVGLEDDHNMGIKFSYDISDRLNLMMAYFRQQDPAGPAHNVAPYSGPGAGTYSYNVIPDHEGVLNGTTASIREMNQFNARLVYELFPGVEAGVSGQLQGLYNSVLDDIEYGHALAAHLDAAAGNWSIKAQFINHDYKARNDDGEIMDRVQMGAYGDPYYGDGVAARANIYTLGIGRSIDVDWGPVSNIMPYVDYGLTTKDGQLEVDGQLFDFQDSHMLVPGFLVTAGNIFTYVDFAMGKNHPWLTENFGMGMGAGQLDGQGRPIPVEDLDWNLRFNINVGYYF